VNLISVDQDLGDIDDNRTDHLRVLRAQLIRADGATTVARSITSTVPTRLLNEDPSPIRPRDEAALTVALEPQVDPGGAVSNVVRARFG
jgi:hypothetical protein